MEGENSRIDEDTVSFRKVWGCPEDISSGWLTKVRHSDVCLASRLWGRFVWSAKKPW
jgi:hypothetical protein